VQKPMLREVPQHYTRLNDAHKDTSNTMLLASRVVGYSRESSVQRIRTIKQYEASVLDETDKLVVIRFHAPWCRVGNACVSCVAVYFNDRWPFSELFV
jgi:hypothetical protein